jgi:hypothetical protein
MVATVITKPSNISKIYGGADFTLSAPVSNNPGGTWTYYSSVSVVASISGTTVTIGVVGATTITAIQSAYQEYASAFTTFNLTINKAAPTITPPSNISKNVGEAAFTLTPPTSNSPGAFTYASSNTNVATISDSTVSVIGVGTTTITATQAATTNYLSGSTTFTITVIISQIAPTISPPANISKNVGDAAFTLSPPTSNSTGAFTYASSNTDVATISGSTVSIVGGGTTTITATQAATADYLSGSTTFTITITMELYLTQWNSVLTGTSNWKNFAFSATKGYFSDVNRVVIFNLDGTGTVYKIISSLGNAITCVVNGSYLYVLDNVIKQYDLEGTLINGTFINVSGFVDFAIYGDYLYATNWGGGKVAKYNLSNGQLVNANFITGFSIPYGIFISDSVIYISTFGASGKIAKYNLDGTAINANLITNLVNPHRPYVLNSTLYVITDGIYEYNIDGTYVKQVSLPDPSKYVSAIGVSPQGYFYAAEHSTNPQTTKVIYRSLTNFPTISIDNISKIVGDAAFTLSPTSNSTGAFTYASSNTAVATISGSTVSIVGGGTTTITATQAATTEYLKGSKILTLTVSAIAPTISPPENIAKNVGDAAFTLSPPTSNSTGAFTYASSNTAVATISGSTVSVVGGGTTTITATQAATADYLSGSTTFTITVKQNPTILYSEPGLKYTVYAGYSNDNVNFYTNNTTYKTGGTGSSTGTVNNISSINVGTNGYVPSNGSMENYSVQWLGYILPDISGTWTFYTTSDDGSFLWIGSTATSGYTTSNVLVQNGGLHAEQERSATITLNAGQFYPIRIQFSEKTGGDNMIVSFIKPGTSTKITNGAGFYFTDVSSTSLAKTFGDSSFVISQPISNSTGAFTYASSNTAVATISGSTVSVMGAGTATITATQAETTNYFSGSITLTITVLPAALTISSLIFANRSLTINLNNTNQSVSGYTYSLDNGVNWTTVSSVSLTQLVISNLLARTFNVIVKAVLNNLTSVSSNMVQCVPKTVQQLQTENYTIKQILDYGYVINDVSLDETGLKTLISSETSLSKLIQYSISPAKIRRYGNFVLQDFKNLGISPSVLSPGKPTITGIEFPTSTTRKITCSLEDLETPGPTSFQIFENNVLIKTISSTDVISNQDGTISLLIKPMITYYNTDEMDISISMWQGIRPFNDGTSIDYYILSGTTAPNPQQGNAILYIGNIEATTPSPCTYEVIVPNQTYSSGYGPEYTSSTQMYSLAGSYVSASLYPGKTLGFLFAGNLTELNVVENFFYPDANTENDFVYCHSISNKRMVGNKLNKTSNTDLTLNSICAFLYNTNTYTLTNTLTAKIDIQFPSSVFTSAYCIVHNQENSYTIVGGFSNITRNLKLHDIYSVDGTIIPYGNGYIVDYDSITNEFTNWTSIGQLNSYTHVQGISKTETPGEYTLAVDVCSLNVIKTKGYFVRMHRTTNGFAMNGFVALTNNSPSYITANSVADNHIVGKVFGNNGNSFVFQSTIEYLNTRAEMATFLVEQI